MKWEATERGVVLDRYRDRDIGDLNDDELRELYDTLERIGVKEFRDLEDYRHVHQLRAKNEMRDRGFETYDFRKIGFSPGVADPEPVPESGQEMYRLVRDELPEEWDLKTPVGGGDSEPVNRARGRFGNLRVFANPDSEELGFEYLVEVSVDKDMGIYPGELMKAESLIEAENLGPTFSGDRDTRSERDDDDYSATIKVVSENPRQLRADLRTIDVMDREIGPRVIGGDDSLERWRLNKDPMPGFDF